MGRLSTLSCLLLWAPVTWAQGNVLLVIADDLGIDNVAAYEAHPDPANTPVLDALVAQGVCFTNAYANPACSPTRATIMTGRYSWHTGLGAAIAGPGTPPLSLDEQTLPELLAPAGRASVLAGKWHLGGDLEHPLASGFLHHWGTHGSIGNIGGQGNGYFSYFKNVDGSIVHSTTYATTETVDDALQLAALLPEPWFLCVAFNAPHVPFHKPPQELHGYALPSEVEGNERLHVQAMIEAMDTELGRLLEGLAANEPTVIFVSDNGPDPRTITPPWDPGHSKGSVFEGGVRVPLIVTGPGVPAGETCAALVHTVDLFATVLELAGVTPPTGIDGLSLLPYLADPSTPSLRESVYVETFVPNFEADAPFPTTGVSRHQRAVRNERFKLRFEYSNLSAHVAPDGRQLFDLAADPLETSNLLEQPLGEAAALAYLELQVLLVEQRPLPWEVLAEGGLAGTYGVPKLVGTGPLVPGTSYTLSVRRGLENSPVALVAGVTQIYQPFLCGLMVPSIDLVFMQQTDGNGAIDGVLQLPPWVGPVLPLTFQAWVSDPAAPCGWSATPALVGLTSP